ncbi:ankyrin repeat and SOCS box protein 1-like [Apostichopus japonicus]|uniref:ankyrin repeat and SOCS box protein 1-like n=1 Tax=Stichopus japonicus TaxID=307972 RepID=UPI003AB6D536
MQFGTEDDYPLYDSAIHQAASNGDITIIRNLLDGPGRTQRVNLKNYLGCTPLRLAASKGHWECVQLLLQSGASIEEGDRKGQTALFMAIAGNHIECVKLLLAAGADPNGRRENMCTPLYLAACAGFVECIDLLLDAHADVNRKHTDVDWLTFLTDPLCVSIEKNHLECFRLLLMAGADMSCGQGVSGLRHLTLQALQKNDPRYLQMLLEFGLSLQITDLNHQQFTLQKEKFTPGMYTFLQIALSNARPLQDLCRFTVRRAIGLRNMSCLVKKLPLPGKLQDFIVFR